MLALAVIAGWLVILTIGFNVMLSSRLEHQVDDDLQVRAQAASATLVITGRQIVGVHDSPTDSELDSSIWVYSASTAIVRPHVADSLQNTADSLAHSPALYSTHGRARFYVQPIHEHGRRIGAIVAAISNKPYERARETVIWGSIVVTVLLLAGAYPVLRIATGRALRPVAHMTRQAAAWSVHAPHQRFGADLRYSELSSLANTLDDLLDRLSALLRHEHLLSAELSHELRTPLARVLAEVDLMLDRARPDQRADLLAIRDSCMSMDEIIDTLLATARSELARTVGRCELAPLLEGLQDVDARPTVTVALPGNITVGVEADVVARMLNPIVENARRYAQTQIRVSATRVESGVAVEVSNDGARIPLELAEKVFEPGFRGGADDPHDGVGLGLALARRLARSVDGEVTVVTDSAWTTFRLVLPAG